MRRRTPGGVRRRGAEKPHSGYDINSAGLDAAGPEGVLKCTDSINMEVAACLFYLDAKASESALGIRLSLPWSV